MRSLLHKTESDSRIRQRVNVRDTKFDLTNGFEKFHFDLDRMQWKRESEYMRLMDKAKFLDSLGCSSLPDANIMHLGFPSIVSSVLCKVLHILLAPAKDRKYKQLTSLVRGRC